MTEQMSLALALSRSRLVATKLSPQSVDLIDQIEAFSANAPVLLIAGIPSSGRSRIQTAIQAAKPSGETLKVDVRELPALALWDILLITTPADRAVSGLEEVAIRQAVEAGRPASVAVTYTDLLGDEADQQAARQEIERFRLNALASLGVSCFFTGTEGSLVPLVERARQVICSAASTHQHPAAQALHRVLCDLADVLGERTATRERDLEVLANLEERLPLAYAHAVQSAQLSNLTVKERLRSVEASLNEASLNVVSAATSWIGRGGHEPWSAVVLPLCDTWQRLIELAANVLVEESNNLLSELTRVIAGATEAQTDIGIQPVVVGLPVHDWSTSQTENVVAMLLAIDVNQATERLHQTCLAEIAEQARRAQHMEQWHAQQVEEQSVKPDALPKADIPSKQDALPQVPYSPSNAGELSSAEVKNAPDNQAVEETKTIDIGEQRKQQIVGKSAKRQPGDNFRKGMQRMRERLGELRVPLESGIRAAFEEPLPERLADILMSDLEAVSGYAVKTLFDVYSEAVVKGTRAQVAAFSTVMDAQVADLRQALADRHAWYGLYAETLELRAWSANYAAGYDDGI